MADGIDGLHIDKDAYLDRNSLLLEVSRHHIQKLVFDDGTSTVALQTITDVEPALDANKAFQNSGLDGYTASRAMRYVAEIPAAIIDVWNAELKASGADNPDIFAPEHRSAFRAKLNDKDNLFLRTGLGTV